MVDFKAVIIDDEPWTREAVKQLAEWEKFGITVEGEASDGEYGLELIRHTLPDIILTDVNMPHLNGIDLIRILREEKNNALVIFISGYDNFEYIRGALQVDAVDYLLKPVKREELNEQLARCVNTLKSRKEEKIVVGEFLDVKWANEFYGLRTLLRNALNMSDIKDTEEQLRAIENLTEKYTGKVIDKSVMVSVYYSLINLLQQYILEHSFRLGEIFPEQDTTFVFSRESEFSDMMQFIKKLYVICLSKTQEIIKSKGRIDLNAVKKFVQEHYTEGITLEQTAEFFYVSKEYLSRSFKQGVGKGFSEYVTSLRMQKAKELIVQHGVSIKDAGELCGYLDQAHFYKTFKKYHGLPPGEFKAKMKK